MSLALNIYCKDLTADLLPEIVKRLNDFDMDAEVHPEFRLDKEHDGGFVAFKFRLKQPYFDRMKDKDLKSGFEISINNFDLQQTKVLYKTKHSFFGSLLKKQQPEIEFATPEIENRLKDCKKVVSFTWHAHDTFELRFASLTSAILTELTNGVCCYPADAIWYDNHNIVAEAFKEVSDFERSLKESDFNYHEFEGW